MIETEIYDLDAPSRVKTGLSTGIHKHTSAKSDAVCEHSEPTINQGFHAQWHSDHGSDSDPVADSEVGSNERTNERTNAADHYGRQSGAGSSRARMYEKDEQIPESIADGMDAFLDELEAISTRERWDVVRSGERELIPAHVRAAVWYRDQGRCADCLPEHPRSDVLHLDHIVPWSAGGPDTTENLRLLCESHNVERSNYVDFARPLRPATWWCANCYDRDSHAWEYAGPYVQCPRHGGDLRLANARCRVARAYGRAWVKGEGVPTWHQHPTLTRFDQIAYCAHCDAPGLTGVVL